MTRNLLVLYLLSVCVLSIVQPKITSITKNCFCTRINPKCISIPYCKLARKDPTTDNFTIDATMLREERAVSLDIKQLRKKGNSFVPGNINIKLNLCDIGKNINSTQYLSHFGVEFYKLYGHLIHSCPYGGRIVFTQLFQDIALTGVSELFMKKGDYKTSLTFWSGREICFVVTYWSTVV